MSQRSQIEWLKFGRLRNDRLFTRTDQCEYFCFHIFCSFLSLRSTPSVVRPLRDNYHFLFPITKADVCNKAEESLGEGIRSSRENSDLEFAPPVSMLWPVRLSPDSKPIMPNSAQKFGQIIRKLTQQRHHFFRASMALVSYCTRAPLS